jgi:CBS domain-containing protein
MKTVRQLLGLKPAAVWSISPDATTFEAIQMLADKGIGALPVMEGEILVGILSERDYARKVILKGKSSHATPVRDIMSTSVVSVTPDQTNEQCMQIMTDHRIRHLPVVEGGKVIGILSIGDLVKDIISEQQATIEHLEHYIMGG